MAKRIIVLFLISAMLCTILAGDEKSVIFRVDRQKGGIVPCLLGIFDTRMGYLANQENVNIYLEDLLTLAVFVPIIGQIAFLLTHLYYGYTGYQKGGDASSFCIGFLGWKTANMMNRTKGRTIEWLAFIPFVNIYSLVIYIVETTGGKTMNEIIAKENLAK